jgi:hypothetical protein
MIVMLSPKGKMGVGYIKVLEIRAENVRSG